MGHDRRLDWALIAEKVSRSTSSLFCSLYHVSWAGWLTGDRHVTALQIIRLDTNVARR